MDKEKQNEMMRKAAEKIKPLDRVTQKANIENLASLKKEFERGLMLPRKAIMLKARLIELFKMKAITEEEQVLMEVIFRREMVKGQIAESDLEFFNRIEMERCEDRCIVKTDSTPRTHHLTKDMVCRYYLDVDADRYVVFVEVKILPEWQMTRDLVLKEQRGHFADESEYPKTKIRVHRLTITQKEFDAWFDFEEDLLNESLPIKEKDYTF
jgi:hypothetical protein